MEYRYLPKDSYTSIRVQQGTNTVAEYAVKETLEDQRVSFNYLDDKFGLLKQIYQDILTFDAEQNLNKVPINDTTRIKVLRTRNRNDHIQSSNMIGSLFERTTRSRK